MESGARAVDLSETARGGRDDRDGDDAPGVDQSGPAAYAAEFIGTFLLVLFIVLILAVNSPAGLGYRDFAVVGLLHAFVLMMLIHALGATSGAHFNPAVTIALTAIRKIRPGDAAVYILLQLAGATAGALVARALLVDEGDTVNYGAPAVSPLLSGATFGGMTAEFLGTFVLVWAIMALAVNPRSEASWAGLVIGATLGFAVMALGPLTGAGFNPARSFGPALVSGEFDGAGKFLLVYVLGPVLGALAAAFGYMALVLRPGGVVRDGRFVDVDAEDAGGTAGKAPIDTYD